MNLSIALGSDLVLQIGETDIKLSDKLAEKIEEYVQGVDGSERS